VRRTVAIVVHADPELAARLRKSAKAHGLKLSPYCFRQLKLAEDAKDNRGAFLELLGVMGVKAEPAPPFVVECDRCKGPCIGHGDF
jgi:hypothetical protein